MGDCLYDPGLRLFVDDVEIQDRPGFARQVQQPQRVQAEPVLRSDRPWEGESVQVKGGVIYDADAGLFKMWYMNINTSLYDLGEAGVKLCYATSADGIHWDKPELGLCPCQGSRANNIVYPPPFQPDLDSDPWGVIKDEEEPDPARRYKMGAYEQHPPEGVARGERSDIQDQIAFFSTIADRHGMYAATSPDGIHWTPGDELSIPRIGDAGVVVRDPLQQRFIATSRRYNTLLDHFVLQWKQYRRVIALSISEDFVHWTPPQTVLKPDDWDSPRDQMYAMTPFVYGNQYLGFLWMYHTDAELGSTELVAARDLRHWQRVGRREAFLPPGSPGTWESAWVAPATSPPVLKDYTLYLWYSGKPQAHGTQGKARAFIGLATLRQDGFVALRCGIRGGDVMTEPVSITGPRLFLNAICPFGQVRVRLIDDAEVPAGFSFEECNVLACGDETDFEITWGEEHRDLSPFVGRRVRLHLQADNATSLFSYRTGESKR